MESEEFKQAECSLQKALEHARIDAQRQLKRSYIDALQELEEIEESRLQLLQRVAITRRYLANICDLKDFKAFSELAPGQINFNDDSNLSRVFGRHRESHGILSVEWRGKVLYPAIQIDPETNTIFQEIQPLLIEAHAKGYTDWDILEWLATEQFEEVSAVPEKPVDYTTPEELLKNLHALGPGEAVTAPGVIPIVLLHTRQSELFNRLRKQWLARGA